MSPAIGSGEEGRHRRSSSQQRCPEELPSERVLVDSAAGAEYRAVEWTRPPPRCVRWQAHTDRSSGTKVERVGEVFRGPRGPAGDEDGRIRVGFDEGLALEHWIGSIPHGTGPRWLLLCYLSCDVVYFSLF